MDWQVIEIDSKVIVRFRRDDGEELLVDETDWGATLIEGADAPTYAVFSEANATTDGTTITGRRVESRDLRIEAAVMDAANNELLRGQVLAFFNPRRAYQVYITYMGRTRWAEAIVQAFQAPNAQIRQRQTFSVYFVCPNPFMQSVDNFGKDLAADNPQWAFPFLDSPDWGLPVSVYNFTRSVDISYDGDATAYPVYTLTASGDVRNPKLIKDGFYVRILDTLHAGDTITLTTQPVRISKNGENILQKVDRTSHMTQMTMHPGNNRVRYEAEYGDNALHVVITYYKQYLGV